MNKYILIIILFVVLLILLFTKKNHIGTYYAKHNDNLIDTLIVHKDLSYTQLIYKKENNTLLFKNIGTWKYYDGIITFHNYFPCEDDKRILKKGYSFKEDLMSYSFPVENSFGRTVLNYNEITAKYYYYKLYW